MRTSRAWGDGSRPRYDGTACRGRAIAAPRFLADVLPFRSRDERDAPRHDAARRRTVTASLARRVAVDKHCRNGNHRAEHQHFETDGPATATAPSFTRRRDRNAIAPAIANNAIFAQISRPYALVTSAPSDGTFSLTCTTARKEQRDNGVRRDVRRAPHVDDAGRDQRRQQHADPRRRSKQMAASKSTPTTGTAPLAP